MNANVGRFSIALVPKGFKNSILCKDCTQGTILYFNIQSSSVNLQMNKTIVINAPSRRRKFNYSCVTFYICVPFN